ncbi:MAG TPA: DNA repair protein RecO [Candidatus Saccharimonadales bacterium]
MNQQLTRGIVLGRIDYGEADRILTLLTPDCGKLRLLARGVRKVKSKLAGGIELFSISTIAFVRGRGEIGTLISTRLERHFGAVTRDIDRTMLGYELIKQLDKATEDQPEAEYFLLLEYAFEALDAADVGVDLMRAWFAAQLLKLAGHTPNLHTDTSGQKLSAGQAYDFSLDDMTFAQPQPARSRSGSQFRADDIKFLRLLFSSNPPAVLQKVSGADTLTRSCQPLVLAMLRTYIRVPI